MKLSFKSIPFDIKMDEKGDGSTFTGHGACFLNADKTGDMMHPQVYEGQLGQFKDCGVIRNEHMVTTGKITDASVDQKGLMLAGKISPTSDGNDQKILLNDGVYKFLSIGQYVQKAQWLETPADLKAVWGQHGYAASDDEAMSTAARLPIRLVTKAQPREVSTTFRPANERASIISVKGDDQGQPGGLTFDEHFGTVLDPVSEFCDRLESYLSTKQGGDKPRPVPPNRKAQARQLKERLDKICLTIEAKAIGRVDDNALFDQYAKALLTLNSLDIY